MVKSLHKAFGVIRRRDGYTLVELLVTITVIAVLIALLIPALSRARQHANTAKCLVNLRQIAMAVNHYCQDNDDMYPTPAEWQPVTTGWLCTDWVYWQPGHTDISQSRAAPYLGRNMAQILLCPADDPGFHVFSTPVYPYSYTLNEFMSRANLLGHPIPIRMGKVQDPSTKILVADESSGTIDDGCWAPQRYFAHGRNLLSNRHEKSQEDATSANDGRGTVAFADCHAAIIPRLDSTNPQYYRAYPDEPD